MINFLSSLRAIASDVQGQSLETLWFVIVLMKLIVDKSAELKMAVPEWFGDLLETLNGHYKASVRSAKLAALKQLRARQDSLKTADEKRKDLSEQIAALEGDI